MFKKATIKTAQLFDVSIVNFDHVNADWVHAVTGTVHLEAKKLFQLVLVNLLTVVHWRTADFASKNSRFW